MSTPAGPAPSVRVDKDRPSWLPWVIGLLLLLILALVLFFVFNGDDDDEDVDVAADPAVTELDAPDVDTDVDADVDVSATPEPTAAAGATQPASPFVLAPPFEGLAAQQGMQVSGTQLTVVDVPADEAFTIGTAQDELLVFITPAARTGAESNANVQPSSTVASLQGTVEPVTEEFLSMLQLTDDEAAPIRERGFYIAATAFELTP